MANYYGQGRTNYVHVKDKEKFKVLCSEFEVKVIEDDKGRVGFYTESESGDAVIYNDDDPARDLFDEALPMLKNGEVLMFVHVGNEKMRYFGAYAVAGNNKGKVKSVDLQTEIIKQAQKLTSKPNKISSCEY